MFDLNFHNLLIAYSKYFNDINDYSKYKFILTRTDNREYILNDIFARFKIYNNKLINNIIEYFDNCKNYF